MDLEKSILSSIRDEATKLSMRHHAYHNSIAIENNRKKERTTSPNLLQVKKPDHWLVDKKYNPFYVNKHAKSIAHSIAKKIKDGTYAPQSPELASIPKKSGGSREVSIYQIPDAAVSTLFYHRLLKKNKHRFSSFSYAYRNDRNVHFAIQDISVELLHSSRIFVAEFDFRKFFDTISHEFLYAQFEQNGFLISNEERNVIKAFLHGREKGIPQGTSISLFLANLTCWKLDKQLEKEGLQFARYADDTIIWSKDYSKISKAFDIISDFSIEAGVAINEDKSDGISLLCNEKMPSEIASRKSHIEFLGYSISVDNVSIKQESLIKIKRQISFILYKHLIQPLNSIPLRAVKIPANDEDEALLSAICEIRRYLYGDLNEEMIRSYLSGRSSRIYFKGIMSFYPIINNVEQMKSMDGWLVNEIYKAVQKRSRQLTNHSMPRSHSLPFSASRKELVGYCDSQLIHGKKLMKIPSFMTIYNAMKKGITESGILSVTDPQSDNYDY